MVQPPQDDASGGLTLPKVALCGYAVPLTLGFLVKFFGARTPARSSRTEVWATQPAVERLSTSIQSGRLDPAGREILDGVGERVQMLLGNLEADSHLRLEEFFVHHAFIFG